MSYYMLPDTNVKITENDISVKFDEKQNIFLNKSLINYLNYSKSCINDYYSRWSTFKKYTNPYEYIHTSYGNKRYVSKLKPLSRAYYKMVELMNHFKIYDAYKYCNIQSLHLAEGPGGFIEALAEKRKGLGYEEDRYIGITLVNNDEKSVPGWKKSKAFLENNKNVKIETGPTEDGDLYNTTNLDYLYETYGNTMDIITGDGGFDFSVDYNNQENSAMRLILTQFIYACYMQKPGGTFILKVFDCFMKGSVDILYLLNCFYNKVYISKPHTSRKANSEKYLVCIGFKHKLKDKLLEKLRNMLFVLENIDYTKHTISSFLRIPMMKYVTNKISNINAILGQQQIEYIYKTIYLINNSTSRLVIEDLKRKNILKCIEWCVENNIPHNNYVNTNSFIQNDII